MKKENRRFILEIVCMIWLGFDCSQTSFSEAWNFDGCAFSGVFVEDLNVDGPRSRRDVNPEPFEVVGSFFRQVYVAKAIAGDLSRKLIQDLTLQIPLEVLEGIIPERPKATVTLKGILSVSRTLQPTVVGWGAPKSWICRTVHEILGENRTIPSYREPNGYQHQATQEGVERTSHIDLFD